MKIVLIGAIAALLALAEPRTEGYLLGPDDQLKIWAMGFEEITDKPFRIEPSGFIDVPSIGRVKAAGLTLDQLRTELIARMKKLVREPQVSIDIIDYGSQPVTVMGAVNQSGVHQLHGNKTLMEVVALAGGLRADAGSTIKIARESGVIPLPNAAMDSTGKFSVAEVRIPDLLAAKNPAENVLIQPHDVITVPLAERVSVIGDVKKPGPILLTNRQSISALEALALAE